MIAFPNAKINIGLHILEKRADGFHNLSTCFYPVGLSDVLEILPAQKQAFQLSGCAADLGENLCEKAFQLLRKDFDLPPVGIYLQKNIPVGAGLGGGSSDAAFTIRMLNEMFGLGLSVGQQQDYSARLGSDCAFFIRNVPVYGLERGDTFEEASLSLKGKKLLLVNPGLHISTREAYAGVTPARPAVPLPGLLQMPVEQWKDRVRNDFEESLFPQYPLLAELKERLYRMGALYASMSGSGSTMYGIFDPETPVHTNFGDFFVWQEELR